MDAEQAAFFDAKGYLVVPAAINLGLVARLNADYDRKIAEAAASDFGSDLTSERGQHNFRESADHSRLGVRLWSAAWEELIDPPRLVPILQQLLNDDRWGHSSPGVPPAAHRGKIRLDHDNIHFRPGQLPDEGGGLHTGYSATACRLLTVVYELVPVKPGQGGFGCL